MYCHRIQKVYLGSARKIQNKAFSGLNSLTDFYFCGSNSINNDIFAQIENYNNWNVPDNLNIHVTSFYTGKLGTRDVNDREYTCSDNSCIKEYKIECTCNAKRIKKLQLSLY